MEGRTSDVVLPSPHNMADPSPSPLHDDAPNAVLVGDGLRPEDAEDSSEVLGVEGEQFVEIALRHPPTRRAV